MNKEKKKDILLAFSGGLDTTYCLLFLKEKDYNVHTVTVNTGSFSDEEMLEIEEKSQKLGSASHISIDGKSILYNKWVSYLLKFTYLRGDVYPPCVGSEREIIVDQLIKICKDKNIKNIAHGSTGAGGDQVRFESALYSRMKDVKIFAPIRENRLSRNEEYEYLKSKSIDVEEDIKKYSINKGMIGITIGGLETLDTIKTIPDNIFPSVVPVEKTCKPTKIKILFKNSLPVKVNNKEMIGEEVFDSLNKIGAENGYGKGYHIGTSIIGLKARIAFEAPAYKMLVSCIKELQKVTLVSDQIFWIKTMGNVYGDMVHDGKYYNPLVKNLEAFADSFSRNVNGEVEFLLNKGNLEIHSIDSDKSLFASQFGTYGEVMSKNLTSEDMKSFCKIYEMESKIFNILNKNETPN